MKITGIKVDGLYGLHHYEIPFDEQENIKIIHAPNGYGKTTLLELISDVINCRLFEIGLIPFNEFVIEFDSGLSIHVIKENDLNGSKEEAVIRYKIGKGEEIKEYSLINKMSFSTMLDSKIPINYIEKNLPFLKRIAQTAWYDTRQNEKISYDEVVAGYGELLFVDEELRKTLEEIKSQMPVHFIHANRLMDTGELSEGRAVGRRKTATPSVMVYSKELTERISQILAKSAALTQELDRTFPQRLIEEMADVNEQESINAESINNQLIELEEKRLKLQEIGLLPVGSISTIQNVTEIDQHTLKVLNLYIKDSQKKLDIFNEIEAKINLLLEIINKRFNYKTMRINKQGGFVFELPDKTLLSPDKLSSGEQNELILIFELLFKSQVNSLILIDEPEISLHIAWQQQFLEDMEAIAQLTDVKIIIATHSPDIINGRWDLTTGLEEC